MLKNGFDEEDEDKTTKTTVSPRKLKNGETTTPTAKTFSAFTQGGATKLGLFYKSIGKKILTNPTYNEATTLWEIRVEWGLDNS